MVPLRIFTLVVVGPGHPSVLVLEPVEEGPPCKKRIVPIWIGPHEAAQIGIAIEGTRFPRPTTHDLFLDTITNFDARVDHVLVSEVRGQTFYARLVLRQGTRLVELDARPTDAIALAMRQNAPFYIEESVLEKASYPFISRIGEQREEELQEFRVFLEGIAPEDFTQQE